MKRSDLDEIIDLMEFGHELVFVLDGKKYTIQPEKSEWALRPDLAFYQFEPEYVDLCRIPIPQYIDEIEEYVGYYRQPVGKAIVEQMFCQKCLNGKSFYDLLDKIEVTDIF